ncbi:hypothetical protein [Halosegnis marinus]|uniref:hypothetical protein n=1 Tax=Halosegnis marinus TaxID=3034023 RepID=UPI00361ECDD2
MQAHPGRERHGEQASEQAGRTHPCQLRVSRGPSPTTTTPRIPWSPYFVHSYFESPFSLNSTA